MKDQETSNLPPFKNNRYGTKSVERHPKKIDLRGSLNFQKLVQIIKKMSPMFHFQPIPASFRGIKGILVSIA